MKRHADTTPKTTLQILLPPNKDKVGIRIRIEGSLLHYFCEKLWKKNDQRMQKVEVQQAYTLTKFRKYWASNLQHWSYAVSTSKAISFRVLNKDKHQWYLYRTAHMLKWTGRCPLHTTYVEEIRKKQRRISNLDISEKLQYSLVTFKGCASRSTEIFGSSLPHHKWYVCTWVFFHRSHNTDV